MRSLFFAALVIVASSHVAAHAEDRKFPYQAIVEIDGVYVRSGNGLNYYPTDKLRKGDKVTVHRHDPGGWCMIAPPSGSFSWIKAAHVQRSGDSAGVLIANNVVVHVGSSLGADEFTTIQGNLSKGDAVQILGEKTFAFEDGPKLMYKISPVKREWRWIQRKAIVAADTIQSVPFPGEIAPRKRPGGPVAEKLELDPNAFSNPISTGNSVVGPGNSSSRTQPPGTTGGSNPESGFLERLDMIDVQFRTMIKQEPSTWNLKEIEQQYTQLDNEASLPSQSKTIALRLDAVARYEKTHREYLNFLTISDEAKQRDAQLASVQRDAEQRALNGNANDAGPQPPPVVASTADNVTPPVPQPNVPKFAGAGMVVTMAQTFPGGPQYALVVPGGKVLAYLIPAPGVDMKRAVNQSMGIIGDRSFRKEWNADVIMVRGMQPVQLRTNR